MLIRRIVTGLSVAAAALVVVVPAAQAEAPTLTVESSRQAIARLLAEHGKDKQPAAREMTAAFSRAVQQSGGDTQALGCTYPWTIRNIHANKYVAAEIGGGPGYTGTNSGMLRARTATNATDLRWESFILCANSSGEFTLIAHNDRYVATELGPNHTGTRRGMLRARTPLNATDLRWETFRLASSGDGWHLIHSVAANKLVAAELGGGPGFTGTNRAMLRARTPIDQRDVRWERFEIR